MAFLEDGYQTLVAFANYPSILLKEKEVTPFGMEGGERIDITTMRNETVKTYAPQGLIEATEMSVVCAYDPAILTTLVAAVNVLDVVDITHSDGSGWSFYGYIKSAIPSTNTIGEQPTMTITIVPTNTDPSGVEVVPSVI
jgi:hypothetical protein